MFNKIGMIDWFQSTKISGTRNEHQTKLPTKNSKILVDKQHEIKTLVLNNMQNTNKTQNLSRRENTSKETTVILEEIPTIISGTYHEDYNILYIDDIIRKKINQEKYTILNSLKLKYLKLNEASLKPQTYIARKKTLDAMKSIECEIKDIENGEKLKIYDDKANHLLSEYKKYSGSIKTVEFSMNDTEYEEMDDELKYKLHIIDQYLEIAAHYIEIDVIRISKKPTQICLDCGTSLNKIALSENGTIICPKCRTEHDTVIMTKLSKDGSRINTINTCEDESIDNFLKAFIRYQGLQTDFPHDEDKVYKELDDYFARNDFPLGHEIRALPLNNKGRRGNTNHKMLWDALSHIGRSEYYEHANLLGHRYWGWKLPDVMHYKELIVSHYNKTQKIFYQIPSDERGRNSSLGTQYRLWRHLQLIGHDCHVDEFRIAENPDSLRTHNKLWRLMCEGANEPDIYYIT